MRDMGQEVVGFQANIYSEGLIVNLCDKEDPGNYRGITLLSVVVFL